MGRLSLDLVLEELPLKDCNKLLINLGCKTTAHEKFKLLSITGGVPRYIEEINPKLSADENIKQLCFDKSGILFREFDDIFHDLFTKKSEYYKKIAKVLVEGDLELSEVCEKLKVQKSGVWGEYLDELVKSGFLKRDFTWKISTGQTSKLSYYRLSDNYLRFYLKYIEPNKNKISTGLFQKKSLSSLPGWDAIMGLQFENLVLNNYSLIWDALRISSNDIIGHGAYFQNKTARHDGCQIDYLIRTRFNTVIACEIKFSRNAISSEVIAEMEKKKQAIVLPRNMAFLPVLIHVNGVSQALVDTDFFTHIIDFSELL